jgi:exopolysaccharide biosynthesis polyprenyl glycosylphosphotransferase
MAAHAIEDSKRSLSSRPAEAVFDLSRRLSLIILVDCVIGLGAYLAAFSLRSFLPIPFTHELMPSERLLQVKHYWWLIVACQPLLLFFLDTYHEIRIKRVREFILPVAGATGIQVLALVAVYFFTENLTFPRTVFPLYWFINSAGVVGWRWLLKRGGRGSRRRALIVGGGPLAEHLLAELQRSPEIGLQVVGIVSDQVATGQFIGPYEVLGRREEIAELMRLHQVREVILTPEEATWKDRLVDAISHFEDLQARVSIVPSIYEILIGRIRHFNIRDIPLIEVVAQPYDPVGAFSRRLRDILFAVIFVILLLPLWCIVAVAIRLSDGGPLLYCQNRVGQRGRIFRVIKFRTMAVDSELESGPVLAKADDPRLTRLGRFLRSYRIDESLQLINVLKGDMSLVGPRPDRPEFVANFVKEIHGYNERHKVKPGITGLAQIRGYYHSDPEIKLKYDLAYICNSSFLLDLVILLETVRIVFRRQGV